MIHSRRGFLVGAVASLIAAPAIVRCTSIMPVKAIKTSRAYFMGADGFYWQEAENWVSIGYALTRKAIEENLYNNTFRAWSREIEKDTQWLT